MTSFPLSEKVFVLYGCMVRIKVRVEVRVSGNTFNNVFGQTSIQVSVLEPKHRQYALSCQLVNMVGTNYKAKYLNLIGQGVGIYFLFYDLVMSP